MYQIEQYLQFSEILIKAYESYPSNFSNIINIKNIFNNEEYINENKYDVSHGNFFKDEDKYGEIEEEDLIKIKKLGRRYLISFNLQNCNIYRRIGKIKIINYEDDWEDYYIPERTKFRVKIVNLIQMKKEQIKIEEKFIIKGNLDKILTEIKDSINLFLDNIIGIIEGYFFRFIAVNSNNTQTEYISNIIKNESISNTKKISNN